jgi:hypothetical protein
MTLICKGDIEDIVKMADKVQEEANKYNIIHVFDDGGYRELLLLKLFNLKKIPGRLGNDAIDPLTKLNYELKTVNLINTKGKSRRKPGISTCHHVNNKIIDRYRGIKSWIIGIFYINKPVRIYEMQRENLEKYFIYWENKLNKEDKTHINNPKIKFDDVINKGILLYSNSDYDSYFFDIKNKKR